MKKLINLGLFVGLFMIQFSLYADHHKVDDFHGAGDLHRADDFHFVGDFHRADDFHKTSSLPKDFH